MLSLMLLSKAEAALIAAIHCVTLKFCRPRGVNWWIKANERLFDTNVSITFDNNVRFTVIILSRTHHSQREKRNWNSVIRSSLVVFVVVSFLSKMCRIPTKKNQYWRGMFNSISFRLFLSYSVVLCSVDMAIWYKRVAWHYEHALQQTPQTLFGDFSIRFYDDNGVNVFPWVYFVWLWIGVDLLKSKSFTEKKSQLVHSCGPNGITSKLNLILCHFQTNRWMSSCNILGKKYCPFTGSHFSFSIYFIDKNAIHGRNFVHIFNVNVKTV